MMFRRFESGFYIRAGLSGSAFDSQTPTSLGGCPFSSGRRSERSMPAAIANRTAPRSQVYLHGEGPLCTNGQ